jgi:hypothetical protein
MESLLSNLNNHTDLVELKKHMLDIYHIGVKSDENRILLRYNRERGADMSSPLVQCCRSLILDINTYKPLCRTFSAKQDYALFRKENPYSSITLFPYYDGTMINVYWLDGSWQHSTKGMLDADEAYWTSSKSFGELFREASGGLPYDILDSLDRDYCYSFVLQHPDNRIVVLASKPRVVLVLVRNRITGVMIPLHSLPAEMWSDHVMAGEVLTGKYTSYEHLEKMVKQMVASEAGVFMMGSSRHTRIMAEDYIISKGLRGNTPNHTQNLLENINYGVDRRNQYIEYYPQDAHRIQELQGYQVGLLLKTEEYYKQIYVEKKYTKMPPYIQKWVHDIHRRMHHQRPDKDVHRFIKGVYHRLPVARRAYLISGYQAQLSDTSVVNEEGTLPL